MNWRRYARYVAKQEGIDPDIFERQIQQESGFNVDAVSPAGARGIAQIMPATAEAWGVDPMNPRAALRAAARNMASYVQKYGGYENALRAYNAGPGAIEASRNYDETNKYVQIIMGGKNPGRLPGKPQRGGTNPSRQSNGQPTSNLFDVLRRLNAATPKTSISQYGQAAATQPGGSAIDRMVQSNYDLIARLRGQSAPDPYQFDNPVIGGDSSGPSRGRGGGKVGGSPQELYELFYDPMGGWDRGTSIGPIGGHGSHVHAAANKKEIIPILRAAKRRFGLTVREHPKWDPVDPVHTEGSYHYRDEAGDVSGDPKAMRKYTRWLKRRYGIS